MERVIDLLEQQMVSLRERCPYLYLSHDGTSASIKGTVFIEAPDISDRYEVELSISSDYPWKIPYAREVGGRIPQSFHHNGDGTLCLEVPLVVNEVFRKDETLRNFFDNLLLPYLYSYSQFVKRNVMPFNERAHGADGVLAEYKDRFKVSDDFIALRLLQILAEDSYRGHHICPCGSAKKLRNCHGEQLLGLKKLGYNFFRDYLEIVAWLHKQNKDVAAFFTKRTKGEYEKKKSDFQDKWGY